MNGWWAPDEKVEEISDDEEVVEKQRSAPRGVTRGSELSKSLVPPHRVASSLTRPRLEDD